MYKIVVKLNGKSQIWDEGLCWAQGQDILISLADCNIMAWMYDQNHILIDQSMEE